MVTLILMKEHDPKRVQTEMKAALRVGAMPQPTFVRKFGRGLDGLGKAFASGIDCRSRYSRYADRADLFDYMKRSGLSVGELSTRLGLPRRYLMKILDGRGNPDTPSRISKNVLYAIQVGLR